MRPIKLPASAALALGILLGAPTANAAVIFGSAYSEVRAMGQVGRGPSLEPRPSEPKSVMSDLESATATSPLQAIGIEATAFACAQLSPCTLGLIGGSGSDYGHANAQVNAQFGSDGASLELDYRAKLVGGVRNPRDGSGQRAEFLFSYDFEITETSVFNRTWSVEKRVRTGPFTEFSVPNLSFINGDIPVVDEENVLYSALSSTNEDVFSGFISGLSGSDSFLIQPGSYTFSLYTGESIYNLLSQSDFPPPPNVLPHHKLRTEAGRFDVSITPAAVVPEPNTWAMMLIGFLGVGCILRRSPVRSIR